jgi:CBS domain containing-hemolysin-like protein
LLILIHAFFVAGEFGLVAVDRARVEQLAEEGDARAAKTLDALRSLSFQLSGAQLGITITSLLVGFLIEPILAPLLEPLFDFVPKDSRFTVSVAVALVLATAFEMVVAELIPQNLAVAKPKTVSFGVAGPMRLINGLMKPLIVFLNSAANKTVRLFGIEPRDELSSIHSLEELQVLIRSSREAGALEEDEFSLLTRSIKFADRTASDVFTPRTALVTVDTQATLTDLARVAVESGHSRIPVHGRDIDDIVGVAHAKDVFTVPMEKRPTARVTTIMRQPLFVPESRDLVSLLTEMRRDGQQIAIVVDEFGGTAGIVTLEDVLEEIVGEIEDEYDPRGGSAQMTEPPSGIHQVSGLLHADEMEEATGFKMPEGDYDTIAGFLLTLFDRIPKPGDHVGYSGWEFKVTEMDRNRISKILVAAPPKDPDGEKQA